MDRAHGVSRPPDFCTRSFLEGRNVGTVRKGETKGPTLHLSALEGVAANESKLEITEESHRESPIGEPTQSWSH